MRACWAERLGQAVCTLVLSSHAFSMRCRTPHGQALSEHQQRYKIGFVDPLPYATARASGPCWTRQEQLHSTKQRGTRLTKRTSGLARGRLDKLGAVFRSARVAPFSPRRRQKGGFSRGVFNDLVEHRSFWGSGEPRAAQKPFEKVGGFAPYLFKGFLGRPGPPRTPR